MARAFPAKETMASVRRHHDRDMQDRDVTTLSVEAEHRPRGSADARTWMVSRRTASIGGRRAPQRNAGHLGIDRETRQRPTAQELRRSDGVGHRPFPAATGPDASRAAFGLDGASGHDTRHRASPGASMNSKTCG